MNIKLKREDITSELLGVLIGRHLANPRVAYMHTCDNYFNKRNEIINSRRKVMQLVDDKDNPYVVDDLSKANHRLPHAYLPEIISQCTNYLVGRPLKLSYKQEISEEDKKTIENTLYKDNSFLRWLQKSIEDVQLYGVAYGRIVLVEEEIKFVNYDPKDVMMIYNDYDDPILCIRTFEIDELVGERIEKIKYTEVYDKTIKDTWRMNSTPTANNTGQTTSGEWEKVSSEPLYGDKVTYEGSDAVEVNAIETGSFPIVEWRFNEHMTPTLQGIKELIDFQDINLSDLANNVDDIQDAIWVLENYNGQNLSQFLTDLKVHKSVKVGQGGNARPETIDIPVEARQLLYDTCCKNIYRFAQAIDFNNRNDLGNVTGVALKWSYAPLEQKANSIETHGQTVLNTLFNILFQLLNLSYDSNDLEMLFDRTMIANELEETTMVMSASSQLSRKTILENLPMVKDVEEEMGRVESDEEQFTDVQPAVDEFGEPIVEDDEEVNPNINNKSANPFVKAKEEE